MDSHTDIDNTEHIHDSLAIYDYFGDDELLDRAIRQIKRALNTPSVKSDSSLNSHWTLCRASALRLRFDQHGARADIQEAQNVLEQLIASRPSAAVGHQAMYSLGRVFETLYDEDGVRSTRERAQSCFEQAMTGVKQDVHGRNSIDGELVVHLGLIRCHYINAIGNIPETISLLLALVERTDIPDHLVALACGCLCAAYLWSWRLGGRSDKNNLRQSEVYGRRALSMSSNHQYRYRFLAWLSSTCRWGAEAGEDTMTVDESITLGEQALELIPENRKRRFYASAILGDLSISYHTRFLNEGRIDDIDTNVKYHRLACQNMERAPSTFYSNLCSSLCYRFQETGQSIDLDSAIGAGQRALNVSPPGDPNIAFLTGNLGAAFAFRFMHHYEMTDYTSAITHLEHAVKQCRKDGERNTRTLLSFCLIRLSMVHYVHFQANYKSVDIDQALEYAQQAVDVLSDADSELPLRLSPLGDCLATRFEMGGSQNDLVEAISCHERALRLVSPTRNGRHLMLQRYGHALRLRFKVFDHDEDIQKSLNVLTEAYQDALSLRHPKNAFYLSEMATSSAARYSRYGQDRDLDASLDWYQEAAQSLEGFIGDRFHAAITGAKLAQNCGRFTLATSCFSSALSLLPRIAWLGLSVGSRYEKLTATASHLGCDAAACAILSGDLEHAVELSDEGRSVFWRSLLQLRTDLTSLEAVAPELAQELIAVGQTLEYDERGLGSVSGIRAEQRAQRRRRAAETWEALIERVRALHGFNSFLKPLAFSELRGAAAKGPVVILNTSTLRSDALIVTNDRPVTLVPLRGLDYATVRQLAYLFSHAVQLPKDVKGSRFTESTLRTVVEQLWQGGLRDVAISIMSQRPLLTPPYRIWWISTGLLGLLPVHCAGSYDAGGKGTADLFISSYASSLSGLITARAPKQAPARPTSSKPRMLAVVQSNVPGLPPLSGAESEVQVLKASSFAGSTLLLEESDATLNAMKNAITTHSWLHCCCHGHSDPNTPLESAFHLFDGPLTLAHILQMRLSNAEFAFLSACHTARYSPILPDESMHMTAALQAAGFRGVLGTAYGMADCDGPVLAYHFYRFLTLNGRAPDAMNAAEALHLAIHALRERGVPLHRWAAFVHFGI